MNEQKISSRQQAFRDAQVDSKAKIVKGSRAWLNTQEMLKRSGRTCMPDLFSKLKDTSESSIIKIALHKNTFNFDEVKHLYELFDTVPKIKKMFSSPVDLEITRGKGGVGLWPYNFIIAPKIIRRKADAFMQINDEYHKVSGVGYVPSGLSESLYKAMLNSCKDKQMLDAKLASLVACDDTTDNLTIYLSLVSGMLNNQSSIFSLLLAECFRLGYSGEYEVLLKMVNDAVLEKNVLERLANVLFFGLLYQSSEENIFSSFFNNNYKKSAKKTTHDPLEYRDALGVHDAVAQRHDSIKQFVDEIYEKYLFTANQRNAIKHRKRN